MRFSAETPLRKIQSPQRSTLRDGWWISSDRCGRGARGLGAAPRAAGEIFFSSHHVRIFTTSLLPIHCPSTAHLLSIYHTHLPYPFSAAASYLPSLLLTTYDSLLTSHLLLGTGDGGSEHCRAIGRISVGSAARGHTWLGVGLGSGKGWG